MAELRTVHVGSPGFGSSMLHYRDGTTDFSCVEQVFKHQHYSMEYFRRYAELLEFIRLRSERRSKRHRWWPPCTDNRPN